MGSLCVLATADLRTATPDRAVRFKQIVTEKLFCYVQMVAIYMLSKHIKCLTDAKAPADVEIDH